MTSINKNQGYLHIFKATITEEHSVQTQKINE